MIPGSVSMQAITKMLPMLLSMPTMAGAETNCSVATSNSSGCGDGVPRTNLLHYDIRHSFQINLERAGPGKTKFDGQIFDGQGKISLWRMKNIRR